MTYTVQPTGSLQNDGLMLNMEVRGIDAEMVKSWFKRYVPLSEVHLWAGFPCADLSSVKSNRQGLEGPASSLFWEVIRVKKLISEESPGHVIVKYVTENVAWMDRQDCEQIFTALGNSALFSQLQ